MEVQGSISDGRTHAEIRAALKRLYGVYERDIELIEGYASQFKRYRVTLRWRFFSLNSLEQAGKIFL